MQIYLHQAGGSAEPPWLLLAGLALVLGLYLGGVERVAARGRRWRIQHSLSFVTGVLLLGLGFALPAALDDHSFSGHAAQHVLIGMLAPVALVLGAPMTLLLTNLSARARRPLIAVLHSPPVRTVSHPATAAVLATGSMYLLYLTPLYAATLANPALHHLVHLHFVASGYLFAWAIAGPDQIPRRPAVSTRLTVLLLSAAGHAILAKLMYAHGWPRGAHHTLSDIRDGAQLMYYGGDIAEVVLAIALLTAWYQARGRGYRRQVRLVASG